MEIRFHLDESVHGAVAMGLRRRGVDVTTAVEAGLRGSSDAAHLAFAATEGRVAVSHDSDFLRLDAAGTPHLGVVYCRQQARTIGQIVNALMFLRRTRTAEEMRGVVEFI